MAKTTNPATVLNELLDLAQEYFYCQGDHHAAILHFENDDGSQDDVDKAKRAVFDTEQKLEAALKAAIENKPYTSENAVLSDLRVCATHGSYGGAHCDYHGFRGGPGSHCPMCMHGTCPGCTDPLRPAA